jgi:voltage-gated potassium channel
LGYYVLGQVIPDSLFQTGRPDGHGWSLWDCAYMTIVTLTTVGYAEVLPHMDSVPGARQLTVAVLVLGFGVALYLVSSLTTFFVEGEFAAIRQRRRMQKEIDKLHEHVIVCGAGSIGRHVVGELMAAHWPFVVIEQNPAVISRLKEIHPGQTIHSVIGDATEDRVLTTVGIDRAMGIVAALPEDKDNLFVTVAARQLNQKLKIVTKAVDLATVGKLQAAGADRVVVPRFIGGLRLASEMIRPNVVEFIDLMLRDRDKNLRLEELVLGPECLLAGRKLAEAQIRQESNLLVIAVRKSKGADFVYGPGPDFVLEEGMVLVVLGETASVAGLRERMKAG